LSQRATDAYEGARESVRRFIHAGAADEIVFVRGTTEAINLVAKSWGGANLRAGDEVLVSEMEHHANIVPWQMLCAATGARLRVLPFDDRGELVIERLSEVLTERTRIVAVTHVSNALGTINPVAEIARAARSVGAVTVIDGAQAVPHMEVDVTALECDFYAFSAHKMYGPTGIGALYGRRQLLAGMPPWEGGGEMIRRVTFERTEYADPPARFEAGTPHIAGTVGLRAAIEYLEGIGRSAIAAHEGELLEYATSLAEAIPDLRIIGGAGSKAGILSFTIEGIHPHDIGTILDNEGIAVRTGHHCAMPVMQHYGVPATVRASFGLYNTRDEIDRLFAAIDKARELFRS
jgi:cysteine desulfurase/selenocysteine lyase